MTNSSQRDREICNDYSSQRDREKLHCVSDLRLPVQRDRARAQGECLFSATSPSRADCIAIYSSQRDCMGQSHCHNSQLRKGEIALTFASQRNSIGRNCIAIQLPVRQGDIALLQLPVQQGDIA